METEDFLAHFGVKGMKWGHHTAQPDTGGSGRSARTEKKLAKATAKAKKVETRQKESDARDKLITDARENVGKSAADLKQAKAQYKVDKLTKGKAAAKETLNKVKNVHYTNVYNANLNTAKETAHAWDEAIWGTTVADIRSSYR